MTGFDKEMVQGMQSRTKTWKKGYTAEVKIANLAKMKQAQALHGLALKCKLINMHELINKSTNDYVTLLPCENGVNVNNKG